ncbi:hypothetical protein [Mesorhizobium sp. M7A.F.Ca.US.008.03.1.1]|uniref:hypothetical protein n=1 Tax=Mesorhizobium sp. M7A.F.Ca.US.008.03.1.1 TaxID=2496742 RepID=UPI000FCB0F87|nr:hypothetical protein [Mesorhizobium sp. M7A.F.Ca.US.008.03.1.1]RUW58357.1 hypothetical protein EOA16_28010 [Mesorhizobium sp. M7A.F.Ca.US.008.03.1.1]
MATNADFEQKLHVSPSINELAIDHFAERPKGNDKQPEPDLEHVGLSAAMKVAREEAHALVALVNTVYADGTQTPAAAVIQVAAAAKKTGERVAARLLAAQATVDATISSLEKATFAPLPDADIGEKFDKQILYAIKTMTPGERSEAFAEAFETGDMTIIGSVLRAPALLSGMKAAEIAALRHRFQQKHHPAEMARLERLKKMRVASDTGGKAFVALIKQAGDTTFANGAIAARTKREAVLAAQQEASA